MEQNKFDVVLPMWNEKQLTDEEWRIWFQNMLNWADKVIVVLPKASQKIYSNQNRHYVNCIMSICQVLQNRLNKDDCLKFQLVYFETVDLTRVHVPPILENLQIHTLMKDMESLFLKLHGIEKYKPEKEVEVGWMKTDSYCESMEGEMLFDAIQIMNQPTTIIAEIHDEPHLHRNDFHTDDYNERNIRTGYDHYEHYLHRYGPGTNDKLFLHRHGSNNEQDDVRTDSHLFNFFRHYGSTATSSRGDDSAFTKEYKNTLGMPQSTFGVPQSTFGVSQSTISGFTDEFRDNFGMTSEFGSVYSAGDMNVHNYSVLRSSDDRHSIRSSTSSVQTDIW